MFSEIKLDAEHAGSFLEQGTTWEIEGGILRLCRTRELIGFLLSFLCSSDNATDATIASQKEESRKVLRE